MSDDGSEYETRTENEGNCCMGCTDVANDRRYVSSRCSCRRNCASAVVFGVIAWLLNTATLAADWYKYYTVAMASDYGVFISKDRSVNTLIMAFCIAGGVVYVIGLVLMIVQWRHCRRHSRVRDKNNLPMSTKTSDGIIYTFRIIMNFLAILLEDLPMCIIYQSYIIPCTIYWTDWIHLGAIAASPFCLLVKIVLCLFLISCVCSSPVEPKKEKKKEKKPPKIRIEMHEDEEEGYIKYDETAFYRCSSVSLACIGVFYLCLASAVCGVGIMVLRNVIPHYVTADWLGVSAYPEDDYRLHIYTYADFNGSYVYPSIDPQPFRGDTESEPSAVPIFNVRNFRPNMTNLQLTASVPCSGLVTVNELGAQPFACLPSSCSVTAIFGYRKDQSNSIVYNFEEINSWRCTSSIHQNLSFSQKIKDYRFMAKNIMKIDFLQPPWPNCLKPVRDETLIP